VSVGTRWEALLGATESPIESMLLTALVEGAHAEGYRVGKRPTGSGTIAIRPQQRVGRFRVDFVVAYQFFGAGIDLVVECDGHAFHERTKHQAARDKRRDRFLTAQGYRLMRFTGAEINASASRCGADVLAMVMNFQTECVEIGAGRRAALRAKAGAPN
jgi:very-short-patch-repair endonuclease